VGGLWEVLKLHSRLSWALTIKNRHIIGTLLAFGVALSAQMVKLPSTTTVLTTNIVAHTAHAHVSEEKGYTRVVTVWHREDEHFVRTYFADIPILAEVAWCESHFTHTNPHTGEVLRGHINGSDVGVMQINEYYHLETAKRMNLDIHRIEDNVRYARFLYEQEGTRPWNASKHCWSARSLAMR